MLGVPVILKPKPFVWTPKLGSPDRIVGFHSTAGRSPADEITVRGSVSFTGWVRGLLFDAQTGRGMLHGDQRQMKFRMPMFVDAFLGSSVPVRPSHKIHHPPVVALSVTSSLACTAGELEGQRLLEAAQHEQLPTVQRLLDEAVPLKAKEETHA
jgi:hypothetical protein